MANKKNYNYFDGFIKLIDFSCQSSEMLIKIINSYSIKDIGEDRIAMHEIEHNADIERHDLIYNLEKEFIPPIEREDIITIAEHIDDLTDSIEDIVMCFYMYNVNSLKKETFELTEVIDKCCKTLMDLFKEFSNFKKSTTIGDIIISVNNYEEEADKLYVDAVKNLYAYCKDPIEVMKWSEIFSRLEKCCDITEDIANILENVIMKNS